MQAAAVAYLQQEMAEAGYGGLMAVRSFHVTNPEGKIGYSLHRKVVLADRRVVYAGSGELRFNSLHDLVEAGTLLRGPVVEEYAQAWDLVWAESV